MFQTFADMNAPYARNLPLKLVILYLVATIVVFAFGPWPWPSRSSLSLYLFLFLAYFALALGYFIGAKRRVCEYLGRASPRRLLQVAIAATFVLFLPTLLWRTTGFSIAENIFDPGAAYREARQVAGVVSGRVAWIEYIRIILSINMLLLVPLLVVYWHEISRIERLLGVIAVGTDVFLALAVGTNKGVGDVLILVIFALLVRSRGIISVRHLKQTALVAAPIAVLFFWIFTQGQISRNDGLEASSINYAAQIEVDRTHPSIRYLPSDFREGAISLSTYMVQGYHGLALCLEQPFVFTWGVGHSRFLTAYADKYLGTSIEFETYPMRAELSTGWDSRRYWQTIFPWIASDVTFPGSIAVMVLLGAIFGSCWKDASLSRNPYAISLFCQLGILFVYVPANNQIAQSGPALFGFVGTVLCWQFTRRRFRIRSA